MIKNKTKKTILCNNKKISSSIFSKFVGLMFSSEIKNTGLIFPFTQPRRVSLHMFFVFYPIDVLFLDTKKKVVEIKKNFKPFTIYSSKKKAKFVIELPKKTVVKSKTEEGDIITF